MSPGMTGVDGTFPALTVAAVSHPRVDRRSVSHRWLAAIALVAVSGGGLLGAAFLGCLATYPAATPSYRLAQNDGSAGEAMEREDRLAPVPIQPAPPSDRTRIEQLSDGHGGLQPYTHVLAHLGRRPRSTDPGPVAEAVPLALSTPAALPPEILFGTSRPGRQPAVTAYAEEPGLRRPVEPLPLGEPVNVSAITRQSAPAAVLPRVIVARPGDRIAEILRRLDVPAADAAEAERLLGDRTWFSVSALKGGETIVVDQDPAAPDQRPRRIRFTAANAVARAVALADDGHYRPVREPIGSHGPVGAAALPTPSDAGPSQSLRDALAGIAEADKLDPALAEEAGRLSGHDIDLATPVTAADTIDLLFADNDLGQPELTYLGLALGGRRYRYYRYAAGDDDSTDYYDATGRSVTTFLLRKPVAAGRLGDGFGWRTHPVLGDRRFHEGVDYAAPAGSPIAAAGAGTVEKIDQEWGYGKYIRIRHDLGYETTYAHVAGFPRGIAVGQRVRQGQTIAFIGSTGLSTGPHLYYEVKVNGRNVDPLRVRLAAGRVLDGAILGAFEGARQRTEALLGAGH